MSHGETSTLINMSAVGSVLTRLAALARRLPADEGQQVAALLRAAHLAETSPPTYNPYLPGVHADPHQHLGALLRDNPTHYSPTIGGWVVTRAGDVAALLYDQRLCVDPDRGAMQEMLTEHATTGQREVTRFLTSLLNQQDAPAHAPLRQVVDRALGQEVFASLRPLIEHEIARAVERCLRMERFDVVADLAAPLGRWITARWFDLGMSEGRVMAALADLAGAFSEGVQPTAALERASLALEELRALLTTLVRARRTATASDGLSAMCRGSDIDDVVLVDTAIGLLLGMNDALCYGVALTALTALEQPDVLETLRQSPHLAGSAVEECLRWETFSPFLQRTAATDLSVNGCPIGKGQGVLLMVATANRDPERFTQPEHFDIQRQPNPHLTFGMGPHGCPGAGLSRRVLRSLLLALAQHSAGGTLSVESMEWRDLINMRAPARLWVRVRGEVLGACGDAFPYQEA